MKQEIDGVGIGSNILFFYTMIKKHNFLLRNTIELFTGFLSIPNSLASLLPLRSQVHIFFHVSFFNN